VTTIKSLVDNYAGKVLLAKEIITLYEAMPEFLVAEVDGEVVGCGALHVMWEDLAEVRTLAVDPAMRGAGVGRRLMAAVEDTARERRLTLLWLTTHDETDACAFYEAVGYTKLGVIPGYSLRPDGSAAPGAFYYKELRGSS
jgi:N-acetylglutamate synthase-like GNAT family acetyltransferase